MGIVIYGGLKKGEVTESWVTKEGTDKEVEMRVCECTPCVCVCMCVCVCVVGDVSTKEHEVQGSVMV